MSLLSLDPAVPGPSLGEFVDWLMRQFVGLVVCVLRHDQQSAHTRHARHLGQSSSDKLLLAMRRAKQREARYVAWLRMEGQRSDVWYPVGPLSPTELLCRKAPPVVPVGGQ